MGVTPGSPPGPSWPQTVAKASWACPIIMICMISVSRSVPRARAIVDMVALLLAALGLALGVAALFGVRRYGRKKILVPAIVGILINGLIVLIWVTNFIAAYERARSAGVPSG